MSDEFCKDDCEYLVPTEKSQINGEDHKCTKYDKKVMHLGNHPKLVKLEECQKGVMAK